MKKIKLNESDLLKIINKVLNEQDERQFNEDELELLHFIFERELKPPFRKGKIDRFGDYPYYNRNGEEIGCLGPSGHFGVINPFWSNIKDKVCQAFGFPRNTLNWWHTITPRLKSWLEDQLNAKITNII